LFSRPVELGAEFIHGDLDVTLSLLKESGVGYHATRGKMYHLENGEFKQQNDFSDHWSELMKRMGELKEDLTLREFLIRFFNDEKYEHLRETATHFAEGFDLADPSDASTIALYKEWDEEWGPQYRIEGGYQRMIDHLELQCKKSGCTIQRNCCVKKISWRRHEVKMLTMCSQYFECGRVVVTVPIGVLQADENDLSHIEFSPSIPAYTEAAKQIGFGTVIKFILEFNESFWNESQKNVGFILTNEKNSYLVDTTSR
jgi:monoamine oxidase